MKRFRVIFICTLILAIVSNVIVLSYISNFTFNVDLKTKQTYSVGDTVKFQPIFEVQSEVQALYDVKKSEIQQREFEENVARAEAILKRYDSPMQGLGHIIVRRADECGGDYKILLAIAGNESLFGRVPVKLYNPYGWLDGVQYASFEDALTKISCYISERYIAKCNKDITCIVRTYAGPGDDKQRWVYNINWFIKQI